MNPPQTQPRPALAVAPARPRLRALGGPVDAEIVAASLRDPDAFAQLFERHWCELHRFCVSRTGAAGEDIAAEVFRIAFDRRDRYDRRYPDARPWLFGIASNLVRAHFRSVQRDDVKHSRSAALESGRPDDGRIGALEGRLLGPRLTQALGDLPTVDRDALLLLAWAELGYEEIARALEVPIGTVRSRIHRARRRVRDYLCGGGR